ncbi:glucan endo-1,3-beta-glucosidase 3-like [Olea europaea var. sylvestris]|uniref:Glucan endo-1,3-beta-glucosidase 12 n=2 Tax=Olea europaea subsp. europaea TaxID=158383 RepID=A0A8S0SPE9_OLEEU|nr:glucan endo-1,3-beta-glucosidase 3-like [Olea europaea var. sylvestris]CAA2993517.1 glucan endo-1,3-beta-glucosidase 12 [Olea europaea subsp. europaea]
MVWFLFLFLFSLISSSTGQESVEFLTLHDSNREVLKDFPRNGLPMAVQVESQYLKNVSKSVLMAETWVRAHVLSHYPATNITSIVIGHDLLCKNDKETKLVLPAIKNIHYSLTRWGLQNDIKVSSIFSSDCLDFKSETYRVDLAENHIKPLLNILQEINSPYLVNPPSNLYTLSDETTSILKSHSKSMRNLGIYLNKMYVIISSQRNGKPTSRKLSFIDYSSLMGSIPAMPKQESPFPAPTDFSEPDFAAGSPLPPLVGNVSPPPFTPPLAPSLPPMFNPSTPPFGPHLPPCNPSGDAGSAAAPVATGVQNGLWCVAKPSVPPETLQEALDYACGEGAADCEAIRPHGHCYFPDTAVAHASYAFNSYWQKNKKIGGSCGFGGTAMLINTDPSYNHCRFVLV